MDTTHVGENTQGEPMKIMHTPKKGQTQEQISQDKSIPRDKREIKLPLKANKATMAGTELYRSTPCIALFIY